MWPLNAKPEVYCARLRPITNGIGAAAEHDDPSIGHSDMYESQIVCLALGNCETIHCMSLPPSRQPEAPFDRGRHWAQRLLWQAQLDGEDLCFMLPT